MWCLSTALFCCDDKAENSGVCPFSASLAPSLLLIAVVGPRFQPADCHLLAGEGVLWEVEKYIKIERNAQTFDWELFMCVPGGLLPPMFEVRWMC
jgi:hypothetical protein